MIIQYPDIELNNLREPDIDTFTICSFSIAMWWTIHFLAFHKHFILISCNRSNFYRNVITILIKRTDFLNHPCMINKFYPKLIKLSSYNPTWFNRIDHETHAMYEKWSSNRFINLLYICDKKSYMYKKMTFWNKFV